MCSVRDTCLVLQIPPFVLGNGRKLAGTTECTMSDTEEAASAKLSSSATSQHQPAPAEETQRDLVEPSSSHQQSQY